MKRLLLIDGHSLIHRAYHAYPRTLATKSGELTNAVYGFTNILLSAIGDLAPTHVAVAFDLPKPTFRETMFVGYKQSRVKPDDDLIVQIPRIKEVVQALNIPIFEVAGYEADDVIGTLCRQATGEMVKMEKSVKSVKGKEHDHFNHLNHLNNLNHSSVVILTSDRDLMQLIRDDIVVVKMPMRGNKKQETRNNEKGDIWNEERFMQEWGFAPQLLPDYKAFAGDQSDDIPGVGGVGPTTAKRLIALFGRVDNVYREIGVDPMQRKKVEGKRKKEIQEHSTLLPSSFFPLPSLIQKLAEDQEAAQLSKKLATIDANVPIQLDWKATEVHEYNKEKVLKLFDELQFKSLVRKLPNDIFEQAIQEVLF